MGKALDAIFNKTLLGVRRAGGDRDVLIQLLDVQLVTDVLNLPKRGVPAGVCAFFQEWRVRSQAFDQTTAPINASIAAGDSPGEALEILIKDLTQFKIWVIINAPPSIPDELISAIVVLLDKLIAEWKRYA